jgi:hypothetical protein
MGHISVYGVSSSAARKQYSLASEIFCKMNHGMGNPRSLGCHVIALSVLVGDNAPMEMTAASRSAIEVVSKILFITWQGADWRIAG